MESILFNEENPVFILTTLEFVILRFAGQKITNKVVVASDQSRETVEDT